MTGLTLRISPAVCVALAGVVASAGAQRPASPDSLALRALVAEARAAVGRAPQLGDDRLARLVRVQGRLGDVDGARRTARALATSWVPFAWLAVVQRDAGDKAGAIATTKLAPTFIDRAQALGYLANGLNYAGDFDEALAIARTIEWPKEQVEEISLAAQQLLIRDRAHPERARELLREALAIARRDTSSWGAYFSRELAYDQAAAGDLAGAFAVVSDTLPPAERAERLGRIAMELHRAPLPRAGELADSVFRVALRHADAVPDTTARQRMRARVRWLYSAYLAPERTQVLQDESRTGEERVNVLTIRAGDRADSARRATSIRELERLGEHRLATEAMVAWVEEQQPSYRRLMALPPSPPGWLDSLAARAVVVARRRSPAYADSTRVRVAAAVAVLRPPLADSLLRELRDSTARSRAHIAIARAWLYQNLDSALAHARGAGPSAARDALYASAVPLSHDRPGRALAIAREIDDPSRRGKALLAVAALGPTIDSTVARAVAEGMDAIDPRGEDVNSVTLASAYHLLGLERLRRWASRQPTPERRAAAYVLLVETLAPQR